MRPSVLNPLFRPVGSIPGIGPKISRLVERFCGPNWADILWHLPTGVHHRPIIQKAEDIVPNAFGTIRVQIIEHVIPSNRRHPYRIICEGCGTSVELVFFNYHKRYLQEKYSDGKTMWISGRFERQGRGWKILHPDYMASMVEAIPEYEVIYPQSQGVTSKLLRRLLSCILPAVPDLPEWLDPAFQAKHKLPFWYTALDLVHHPKTERDLDASHPARMRLAYDEVLANQLALLLVRQQVSRKKGISIQPTGFLTDKLIALLPFQLTGAQQRVLIEIAQDLNQETQMIRLLQGDVGSGKTIVALLAALSVIEDGFQAAIMAPTDILARQHFAKIEALCQPLGVRVGLLTGREKGQMRQKVLTDLADGTIQLLIGTHALFTEDVSFHRLGLAVIDEQHKFGVHQRLALIQKQKGVNLLVMTATPIPRSLALTVYGDMDSSRLDEKPEGRQSIETRVMPVAKIEMLVDRLYHRIQNAPVRTQAYWICPLVEESEKTDLTAVKARYAELQKTFGDRVGLLHGKMKGPEKDAVMEQFASGHLDVLVATTVIEVGVDVKSATVMIIEQAERFGLAGLHQLRGRVGRGSDKSLCILLHGPRLTETAKARLRIMRETDDGFVLAEEDLKLRGAGEILGARQSGMPEFRMADMQTAGDLLWTATKDAQTILSLDPKLESPRGQALRILLYLFQKDTEIQTLKAG